MSTLGLYPEDLDPEIFYFQWPGRTKIKCIYKSLLKEGNGDHKYLRFPNILDKNFEVVHVAILLDKVDFLCAETVKEKPTVNYSGFITYSNTIYFSGLWLDNYGYLIN